MNRRNFIKGAAVATTFPAAIPTATAGSNLLALIQEHEKLYAVDSKAWGAVADIDDANMRDAPKVGVQVSRLLVGIDGEGQNIFKPILETTEEGVRAHYRDWAKNLFPTPQNAEQLAARVARLDKAMNEKLAELEELRAARQRFEDQCGYTAAMDSACASAEKVKHVERLIIDHVPATLQEAALKARWLVAKINDDGSYLLDTEGCLEDALASIGRA